MEGLGGEVDHGPACTTMLRAVQDATKGRALIGPAMHGTFAPQA
ncbi:hypothetical protein HMPREF9946_00428 [Acetobacteraceae bacterium AT-5844]|nr:hypothetical protein HMPREF9946_00428 [Acetobacteraceae bacterium AT-5844]